MPHLVCGIWQVTLILHRQIIMLWGEILRAKYVQFLMIIDDQKSQIPSQNERKKFFFFWGVHVTQFLGS